MKLNRFAIIAGVLGAAAVSSAAITGSYTTGGTTTGTGPWNMTSTDTTFGVLRFNLDSSIDVNFEDLTDVNVSYDSNLGGIAAGAPRLYMILDADNDDVFESGTDAFIQIHWGPAGTFADPTVADGLNTGNLVMMGDLGRYDLSGAGGGFYTDRAAALALVGSARVWRIGILLDSFGGHDRDFDIHGINASAVPEPATMAVFGVGAAALLRRRSRR